MRETWYRNVTPKRSFNAAFILIGVNLAAFLLRSLMPREIIYTFSMIPVRVAHEGMFWQLFTYMFLHADFYHLLFNMLGLFFFGVQVEQRMGSREFLVYYLFCGLAAGVFSFVVFWYGGTPVVVLLGASGAVYAVLLAFATYFPYANILVMGFIPVPAPLLVLIYTVIELFSQMSGARSGIAHLTHLAGFGAGFLYFLIRLRINPIEAFMRRR